MASRRVGEAFVVPILFCVLCLSLRLGVPPAAAAAEEQGPAKEHAVDEDVEFVSRLDGSRQRYLLRRPAGWNAETRCDVLVALHGHGSDRRQYLTADRGECAGARDVAAKRGILFVSPDYRGNSWMGATADADLLQILDDLKERFRVGRVFVTGGSMGGTSALIFTALHPDKVAGVAALNPMADLGEYDAFLEAHPILDIRPAIHAAYGGDRGKAPAEYEKRSPARHPERFTMPVAITTGGKDTVVPPESAIRLAGRLKALDRRVLHLHRPEGGHDTNYADTVAAVEFALGVGQ